MKATLMMSRSSLPSARCMSAARSRRAPATSSSIGRSAGGSNHGASVSTLITLMRISVPEANWISGSAIRNNATRTPKIAAAPIGPSDMVVKILPLAPVSPMNDFWKSSMLGRCQAPCKKVCGERAASTPLIVPSGVTDSRALSSACRSASNGNRSPLGSWYSSNSSSRLARSMPDAPAHRLPPPDFPAHNRARRQEHASLIIPRRDNDRLESGSRFRTVTGQRRRQPKFDRRQRRFSPVAPRLPRGRKLAKPATEVFDSARYSKRSSNLRLSIDDSCDESNFFIQYRILGQSWCI